MGWICISSKLHFVVDLMVVRFLHRDNVVSFVKSFIFVGIQFLFLLKYNARICALFMYRVWYS